MSRTATTTFLALLVALSSPALAQIGLRTATPRTAEVSTVEETRETPDAPPVKKTVQRSVPTMDIGGTASVETCEYNPGLFPLYKLKIGSEERLAERTLCFWNQEGQEYVKYGRFVSSSNAVSATTEILSDAFGPVRIALSTAVATTTDDDDDSDGEDKAEDETTSEQDEALNLLAANGGNLALTASYPLYYQPFSKGKGGSFLWNSYLRVATNVSALGSTTESTQDWEDVSGNVELAFTEMQLDLLSLQENFNLLGYLKTSAIFATDKFAESLHADASKSFLHAQIGAGMRIGEILMVHATYNWYSDGDIPGDGGTVTFTMTK